MEIVWQIILWFLGICFVLQLLEYLVIGVGYALAGIWKFLTHKTTLSFFGVVVQFFMGILYILGEAVQFFWGILTKILGVAGSVTKGVSIFGGGLISKGIDSYTHLQEVKLQYGPSNKEKMQEKENKIKEIHTAWQKAKDGDFEELVIVNAKYGNEALRLMKDFEKMSQIQER